jgi:hypothetical protein
LLEPIFVLRWIAQVLNSKVSYQEERISNLHFARVESFGGQQVLVHGAQVPGELFHIGPRRKRELFYSQIVASEEIIKGKGRKKREGKRNRWKRANRGRERK